MPLVVPTTSMAVPASNTSAVSSWPAVKSAAFGVRISATCRRGVTPAFSKWPLSGLVTLRGSIVPKPSCTALYPSAASVRTWVTTFVPTWTTVTGTSLPDSSQTWVMPSLRPSRAVICFVGVVVIVLS